MKTQWDAMKNVILTQENDKLRAENDLLKQAMKTPVCKGCGGPAVPDEISYEEHRLRIEYARLKGEALWGRKHMGKQGMGKLIFYP
ncbi:hypothetical protein F3Y22_tig00006992pilonHSYRG00024 [Hibiscus syriacus]|uniref:Uncharacterized protein n=1 Tax=Hibiscus syriacus TaxID=106335 RepID=A0A6A3CFE5_HIBSY|nr:hypothetical protein F3Y22_tig00006992pilonHSYRG00024 [Hibiscus syriacus]